MFPLITGIGVLLLPPSLTPDQVQSYLEKAHRDQAERVKIVEDLKRKSAAMEKDTQRILQKVAATNKRVDDYIAKKKLQEAEQKKQAEAQKQADGDKEKDRKP